MKRLMGVALLCLVIAATADGAGRRKKKQQEQEQDKGTEPAAATEVPTDAAGVLKLANAAAEAVRLVSYDVEFKASGWLERRHPALKGKVIVGGEPAEEPERVRIEVGLLTMNASVPREHLAVYDGTNYTLVDHRNRRVIQGATKEIVGNRWNDIMNAAVEEFYQPNPLGAVLNVPGAELKEDKKIGDVDCYQVQVTLPGGGGEITWCFGKKDFLIRRAEQRVEDAQGARPPCSGS